MLKWDKLGKIFDPSENNKISWMDEFAQSPSCLLYDTFIRVYFCSRPKVSTDGQYLSYLSYIDLDRNNPLKIINICSQPILSLGATGTFDEFGTNPISVIRYESEVRVYYAGWTRCESVPFNGAIGVAISNDNGDSFERVGAGPVIPYTPDEPFLMGSPRIRKFNDQWVLFYVAGKKWLQSEPEPKPEPVYKIRMAKSNDGINWVKHNTDLIPDVLGEHECQACPDIIFRDGKYHMFFSYRDSHNYKTSKGGYRIGYASSIDMETWHRNDEIAGIGTSENGWDSEMVSYPHIFLLEQDTYMLYQGNEMGRSGIGLAKLNSPQNWANL